MGWHWFQNSTLKLLFARRLLNHDSFLYALICPSLTACVWGTTKHLVQTDTDSMFIWSLSWTKDQQMQHFLVPVFENLLFPTVTPLFVVFILLHCTSNCKRPADQRSENSHSALLLYSIPGLPFPPLTLAYLFCFFLLFFFLALTLCRNYPDMVYKLIFSYSAFLSWLCCC